MYHIVITPVNKSVPNIERQVVADNPLDVFKVASELCSEHFKKISVALIYSGDDVWNIYALGDSLGMLSILTDEQVKP